MLLSADVNAIILFFRHCWYLTDTHKQKRGDEIGLSVIYFFRYHCWEVGWGSFSLLHFWQVVDLCLFFWGELIPISLRPPTHHNWIIWSQLRIHSTSLHTHSYTIKRVLEWQWCNQSQDCQLRSMKEERAGFLWMGWLIEKGLFCSVRNTAHLHTSGSPGSINLHIFNILGIDDESLH